MSRKNIIEIRKVSSIVEFVEAILDLRSSWSTDTVSDIWYRGVKDASFDLLPKAYRLPNYDEQSLALYFRSRSPSLLLREPLDDWEWYYLMQHYGIPTRLLDWTENPLAALYFALEEDAPGRSPCVWLLDPSDLNQLSGEKFIIFPYPGKDMDYWLPDNCSDRGPIHNFPPYSRFKDNTMPLAIYPKQHNARIVAQRGVFTVHGMSRTAINHLPLGDPTNPMRIAKIVFKPSAKPKLRDELLTLGISKVAIYPEAQSLSDDLRKAFQVE